MWVIFIIIIIPLGLWTMWLAIFGEKDDVKEYSSIPTDFVEFILMIMYKLFPTFLKRIFLFLGGIGLEAFAIYAIYEIFRS